MDGITLPPELEQFVAEAVASGRFHDINDVVRHGVELLRQREHASIALTASVLAAQAEGDREGFVTGDALLTRIEDRLAARQAASG